MGDRLGTVFGARQAQIPSHANVFCYAALRVANEIGDDVGIQHVTHHSSTGSGAESQRGRNSPSSGARVATSASSDFGGAGSMISLSPPCA